MAPRPMNSGQMERPMRPVPKVMNTKDVLNAHLYPGIYTNTRRKDFPYYDYADGSGRHDGG